RRKALLAQREQLKNRAHQTEAMIRAIDTALAVLDSKTDSKTKGGSMDMKQIFDGFDPSKYEEEARQRWGETDAYKESMKRTSRYMADDWKAIQAEQAAIYKDAFEAMK